MRRRHLLIGLLSLAACRHATPARAVATPCKEEAGAGCLEKGGEKGTLLVKNFSKRDVCHAHFRPSSADDWSEPIDDSTQVPAGQELGYHIKPALWDVKLSDCKGAIVVERLRVGLDDGGAILIIPGE